MWSQQPKFTDIAHLRRWPYIWKCSQARSDCRGLREGLQKVGVWRRFQGRTLPRFWCYSLSSKAKHVMLSLWMFAPSPLVQASWCYLPLLQEASRLPIKGTTFI